MILDNEPIHISEEKNAISQSTQELVFTNYKTFIKTAENSREIFKEVYLSLVLKNVLIISKLKFKKKLIHFFSLMKLRIEWTNS